MSVQIGAVIAIVGMPGCGKSTLSHHLAERLAKEWTAIEISLDDALQIQCPAGEVDFQGAPLYVRRGAHFVLEDYWRPRQMTLATSGVFALMRLFGRASSGSALPRIFLLEFPLTELPAFEAGVTAEEIFDGVLVLLSAKKSTCRVRNLLREEKDRVPESVLDYFDEALLKVNVPLHCDLVERLRWRVIEESTEGSMEEVLQRIATAVDQAVKDLSRDASGSRGLVRGSARTDPGTGHRGTRDEIAPPSELPSASSLDRP